MAGRWREGSAGEPAGDSRISSRDVKKNGERAGSPAEKTRASSRDVKKKEPKLDLAFEFDRTWGAEKMTLAIREMLAEQTKQLQASVSEEVQKVQGLLAHHTQQLAGCVANHSQEQTRELQVSLAAQTPGGLEELLRQEMQEMRRGQAGLRDMINAHGGAVARVEALFQPLAGLPVSNNPSTAREESKTASSVPSSGIAEEAKKVLQVIQTGTGAGQEDQESQRTPDFGLREMIEQHGVALARIEASVQSLGGANVPGTPPGTPRDEEKEEEEAGLPPVLQTETGGTQSTFGVGLVDLNTTVSHKDRSRSVQSCCRAICHSRRFFVCTAFLIAANSIWGLRRTRS
jgi:hypothetical protein